MIGRNFSVGIVLMRLARGFIVGVVVPSPDGYRFLHFLPHQYEILTTQNCIVDRDLRMRSKFQWIYKFVRILSTTKIERNGGGGARMDGNVRHHSHHRWHMDFYSTVHDEFSTAMMMDTRVTHARNIQAPLKFAAANAIPLKCLPPL